MESSYLADIIILLIAAVIAVPFSQAAKLGAVPGFLLAGIVVGPSGLGLIGNIQDIGRLAEIGVVFLLFIIGIELKPSRLWQMRTMVFGLGTLQILVTGMLIAAICVAFGLSVRTAVLVGPALALSSTAFVLQLLTAQKTLSSHYGRTSLSILLMQDLAVVPLLVLVPILAAPELSLGKNIGVAMVESILIVAMVIIIGKYLLHPVLHRVALSGNPDIFTASAILIVLGTALITEHAGLSMAMGAFLAGLLISDSFYRHQVKAEIQPFRGLLLGLFFISMGMSFNLNYLFDNPILSLGLVALLLAIKAAVLYPLCYLFKIRDKNGLAVSLVLAQSGEFALVLFSLAYQSKMLDDALYQQLLLVVLISMLATPVLANLAYRLVRKNTLDKGEDAMPEAPIVIAGYGRVGHRIGEILTLAGKTYVALDSDANIVERARANGHPVFFGDVQKPEVLKAAGASRAHIIIVTLNDPSATVEVVSSLRKTYPNTELYARGHHMVQCRELHGLGASGIVSENIEASLELARMALVGSGVEDNIWSAILDDFRERYNAQIYDKDYNEADNY